MFAKLTSSFPNPLPSIKAAVAKTPYLGATVHYAGKTVSLLCSGATAGKKAFISAKNGLNEEAKRYTQACDSLVTGAVKVKEFTENTLDLVTAAGNAVFTPVIHPLNTAAWMFGTNNVKDAYSAFQLNSHEIPLDESLTAEINDERAFSTRVSDAGPHLFLGAAKAAASSTLVLGTLSNALVSAPTCSLEPSMIEHGFNSWHENSREYANHTWKTIYDTASGALPVVLDSISSTASQIYSQSNEIYATTTKADVFNGLVTSFSYAQTSLQVGGTAIGITGFLYIASTNYTKCVEASNPLSFIKHGALSAMGLTAAVATPFFFGTDTMAANYFTANND